MEEERTPLLGPSSQTLSQTEVYPLIHWIRVDVTAHIDAPLTYEQLLAPDSTYTIVRPLTDKYLDMRNHAVVFCLLLNRVQFLKDSSQLSISTLSQTRATLCEILAVRVLRGWSERTLPLSTVLLTPWALFQGASEAVVEKAHEEGEDDLLEQAGNALEMAVISGSKRFIRSPSCQKVIEGIWTGRIIYSSLNAHALIADNYKRKPIQLYNPHKAPLLDHYRLKVPKIRSVIEYMNFLVLFVLYVSALENLQTHHMNWKEVLFIVYALGFSLDKLAAVREHGLKVFSSSLVNGFDLVFILMYAAYLSARLYGFHYHEEWALSTGADILAIGAVLIFPRLAFVTLANNLMVLSIRSMLVEFFFLMGVGFFCFLGFLYALYTLGQGQYPLSTIGWWLLEVYFGLDASGFESAHAFHPFLGPILMVTYALLSNTLLLTVLVAILGNTFATINQDAAAESMFRKAVATIEGVKSDAVFSYHIPFNLLAVAFMYPMSYILTPRWFHKLNVTMIRITSFPILLGISLYERQTYKQESLMEQLSDAAERYVGSLPRRIRVAAGFDGLRGTRKDFGAVFEIEREVGNFYQGWDDDGFDDIEPIGDDAVFEDDTDHEAAGAGITQSPGNDIVESPNKVTFPKSASPPPSASLDGPRRRRTSMPISSQVSPIGQSFPPAPGGLTRVRRNSTVEPSPLARLFVRSPTLAELGQPRMTRGQSMSVSKSQPAMSSIFQPSSVTRHRRTTSQPVASSSPPTRPHPPSRLARPAITPIDEDKRMSYSGRKATSGGSSGTATPVGTSVSIKSRVTSPVPGKDSAGKVTDLETVEDRKEAEVAHTEMTFEKLDAIDRRQRRLEAMLSKLLGEKLGQDVFDQMD